MSQDACSVGDARIMRKTVLAMWNTRVQIVLQNGGARKRQLESRLSRLWEAADG